MGEHVGVQRASTGRAARYLPLLFAASLAGCGSSGATGNPRSVAGVTEAAQQFRADLQPGHYSEACEAFTATARASLATEPGGCAGSLPQLYAVLGKELDQWFNRVLPSIQVQGDAALYNGNVQARYEHGRWHFENNVW
jgi:hypothetical protein